MHILDITLLRCVLFVSFLEYFWIYCFFSWTYLNSFNMGDVFDMESHYVNYFRLGEDFEPWIHLHERCVSVVLGYWCRFVADRARYRSLEFFILLVSLRNHC